MIENHLYCLWQSFIFLDLMADNIQRALQYITHGSEDAPFVLPTEAVRRAEEENRFILIEQHHRQKILEIVVTMKEIGVMKAWFVEELLRVGDFTSSSQRRKHWIQYFGDVRGLLRIECLCCRGGLH